MRKVCRQLVYLNAAIDLEIGDAVRVLAESTYPNTQYLDHYTDVLCGMCKRLEEENPDVIYDGKNPSARKLADWWDHHKEWDARRNLAEEVAKQKALLKKSALEKLTAEERRALGL